MFNLDSDWLQDDSDWLQDDSDWLILQEEWVGHSDHVTTKLRSTDIIY